LAFFETVCQKRNGLTIWPFFNVDKNSIFQGFVLTNLSKFRTVYEILNFLKVILTKNLKKIWPSFGLFSFFRIWPFLKLLMAKCGLLNFFGPGNPEWRIQKFGLGVQLDFFFS